MLFEQSTVFWNRYSERMFLHSPSSTSTDSFVSAASRTPSETQGFYSGYQKLFSIVSRIMREVPVIQDGFSTETNQRLLVIHALLRATMIRLHSTFGADDPSYRQMFLDMAEGMIKALASMKSAKFWDPIMAVN